MNKDYTFEVNETVNSFINSLSDDELRSIINDTDQESRLEELTQKSQTVSIFFSLFDNQLIYYALYFCVIIMQFC